MKGFFSPKTSDERLLANAMKNNVYKDSINKHKISVIECTFTTDHKGISLTLDCEGLDIDKEQLNISIQDKKDLLNCHNIEDLIPILGAIKRGEWMANTLKAFLEINEESIKHTL